MSHVCVCNDLCQMSAFQQFKFLPNKFSNISCVFISYFFTIHQTIKLTEIEINELILVTVWLLWLNGW